ncbi:MAG: T9SS type A sorting domain-containing protein [Bacteroidetes bacterium]|nr:T9SS type A sorting domain-containing protein [Bacteroidota bacterium]
MTDGFVAKYGYILYHLVEEIISGNDFISLYPNPSIDIVYFKLKNESRSTLLSVYNSLGSKVYEATIPANDSDYYSIDISKLSSGVYFFTIKTSSGISQESL